MTGFKAKCVLQGADDSYNMSKDFELGNGNFGKVRIAIAFYRMW